MIEYTLLSGISVFVVVVADLLVLRTRLLAYRRYWVFLSVMFAFMVIANGYLTRRPIVLYGDQQYMGIRLDTIPVEDFLFGFSLITATIICWEHFGKRLPGQRNTRRQT
jgi:lycopene cyclase domain-containing protein